MKVFLWCNMSAVDIRNEKDYGLHYIIEFTKCNPEGISNVQSVREIFVDAAKKSQATILNEFYHQFNPYGVSGVILIAESHFTIHTWPEDCYAAVDIFTCGEMDSEAAIELMKSRFKAETHIKILKRGPNNEF